MTTFWGRSPLQHLQCSGDNTNRLHWLSQCRRSWLGCYFVPLWMNNNRNIQFGCSRCCISFTAVINRVPASRLCQFVKPHLLLLKSLHVLLYNFRYCAHHPAGLVIFAQLAQLSICIILIIPILLIVGNCKIAQTISYHNHHLLQRSFGLSGCQFRVFRIYHIFLLSLNRCLCIINSLCCHSGFSLNIILDPFLFLFVA